MKETILELHRYNTWANARVADAFSQLNEKVPAKSLHLFSHIINAQHIWLARLQGTEPPYKVFQDHDVQTCIAQSEISSQALVNLIERMEEEWLNGTIHYTNTQGKAYHNYIRHILMHAPTHSTYHRAQIALDMRQNGLEPMVTDFIAWARDISGQL